MRVAKTSLRQRPKAKLRLRQKAREESLVSLRLKRKIRTLYPRPMPSLHALHGVQVLKCPMNDASLAKGFSCAHIPYV